MIYLVKLNLLIAFLLPLSAFAQSSKIPLNQPRYGRITTVTMCRRTVAELLKSAKLIIGLAKTGQRTTNRICIMLPAIPQMTLFTGFFEIK